MLMFDELASLAEEKCCNEIVMFMVVYPVSSTLRPVCDCKLIRCVDLHTCSRSMFGYSRNFVLFSCLSYYLGCFHYTVNCMCIFNTLIIATRHPYPEFRPLKQSLAMLGASPRIAIQYPPPTQSGWERSRGLKH